MQSNQATSESYIESDTKSATPNWVLIALATSPAVAFGLSRFAYALLIPSMQDAINLTYSQLGNLGTANNIGYLFGALLSIRLVRQETAKTWFKWGIFLTGFLLLCHALSGNYYYLLAVRFLSGIPAALALVGGGVLATQAGQGGKSELALDLYYAGGGAGIILSTAAAQPVLSGSPENWSQCWLYLGAISIAVLFFSHIATKHIRDEGAQAGPQKKLDLSYLSQLSRLALTYFGYGLGYSVYMTFVIDFLRSSSSDTAILTTFWLVLGLSSIIGAFGWTKVFQKVDHRKALSLVNTMIFAGSLIIVLGSNIYLVLLSAVVFGCGFLSVVAAVNNSVKKLVPKRNWGGALAAMTIATGVGQCFGPAASGLLAEHISITAGMLLAPIFLIIASSVALFIPKAPFGS